MTPPEHTSVTDSELNAIHSYVIHFRTSVLHSGGNMLGLILCLCQGQLPTQDAQFGLLEHYQLLLVPLPPLQLFPLEQEPFLLHCSLSLARVVGSSAPLHTLGALVCQCSPMNGPGVRALETNSTGGGRGMHWRAGWILSSIHIYPCRESLGYS